MRDERRIWDEPALQMAATFGLLALGSALLTRSREVDLRGKTVLITGSSRGLGLAMAREFAAHGCRLALCARDAAELDRARADIAARGAAVFTAVCDVSDRAAVASLISQVTDHFGAIDIVVNNAGTIATGPVETVTLDDIAEAMDVMFWGVANVTWAVLPQMQARKSGRIVNITSIGGKVAVPHLLSYCVAKFAATGLSEGLRAELAKDGIVVTTVAPGLMRTGSYLRAFTKGQREREFILFGAMDNLPLFSISAESAARRIVQATRRGEAEVVLSPQASAMALFHGILPGAMSDIMGLVNRFLPGPDGGDAEKELGLSVQERVGHPNVADPMGLGRRAADDLNQFPAGHEPRG